MNDPFPPVVELGEELQRRRDGWQKAKALVLLAALSPQPAQDLAVALGIPEDLIESIWREARAKRAEQVLNPNNPRPKLGVVA